MTHQVPRPWTDEEYGFVQDSEWPAWRIAEELGRTEAAIYNLKHKFRNGWSPKQEPNRAWLPSEDQFLVDNPRMTGVETARHLGRTEAAVQQRRVLLRRTRTDVPSFGGNFSPFAPGARSLLAQTCPSCGYLLQEKWFQADDRGRCKTCKRCREADRQSRGIFRSGKDPRKADQYKAASLERYRHWQRVTIDRAENRGQPWTDSDLKVLADPDMTIFQKAIFLKRTWAGVQVAAAKNGFNHKRGLGDPERDQWIIDNPNAKEYAA